MVLKYCIRRIQTAPAYKLRNDRVNVLFQALYPPAVNRLLRARAIGVDQIPVGVKKFCNSFANNGFIPPIRHFYHWRFQEIAHTLYQRVVVNNICKIFILQGEIFSYCHRFRGGEVRGAREPQHRVKSCCFCPFINNLTKFYVSIGGMMHLIDEDGKMGDLSNDGP